MSRLTRSRRRYAWLFLAPMLFILVCVAGWPLIRTIWYSLTDANFADPDARQFVGIDNYLHKGPDGEWYGILAEWTEDKGDWWRSVWNTLVFSVISVSLETALGVVFALVLNASFKLRGLVRAAVLVPWAIPTIVSAQMWKWILDGQNGMLNDFLMKTSIIAEPISWIVSEPMTAAIMADVWKTTPFMTLLILAALQMLPKSCYEAARVDGVHPAKVFFYVTLPLIRPALMVAVIFRFLDALRVFDLIYVLTPNNRDTMTMSVYVRRGMVDFGEMGYGSAASTMLFVIVAACTVLYLKLGRVNFEGGR